jgi:dienelactone hydrolase
MRWIFLLLVLAGSTFAAEPKTVRFRSEDRQINLVGYLFEPSGGGTHAAVVMLHGRAGPYSSLASGVYTAATLSKRHKEWGQFWAERGYIALLVDSFGSRRYPAGFPKGNYEGRPSAVSEQTVRPLDAYGALRYLRGRRDIIADHIGVQGWSNGGMTVLVTMSDHAPGIDHPTPVTGFRAAIAEYPGCGMEAIKGRYVSYSPILMMIASADEEVSPKRCEEFAQKARAAGSNLDIPTPNTTLTTRATPNNPSRQTVEPRRTPCAALRPFSTRVWEVTCGQRAAGRFVHIVKCARILRPVSSVPQPQPLSSAPPMECVPIPARRESGAATPAARHWSARWASAITFERPPPRSTWSEVRAGSWD